MNRKNLTAAVLAGLAGAAGIAGTAQAVNLNPDGLGQVLMYPYYTTKDGYDTYLSVVNTTDSAKAVKVRFKEGYNSREVLDFNMYMSAWDVWQAAIVDGGTVDASQAGVPHLIVPDTTCTVPYLYGDGIDAGLDFGLQAFLPFAYTGKFADGGPTGIERTQEGHFEMIEMGTLTNDSEEFSKGVQTRLGSADAATHILDDDGKAVPEDCQQLVDNWSVISGKSGMWLVDETKDIARNSGGLFGGASLINVNNATLATYNARAIQGYDKKPNGNHFEPGDINPNLNDGSETTATIFFGVPQDTAVALSYLRGVDAISATFMHEYTMNEYLQNDDLNAASEWVVTFPTKNWYVDPLLVGTIEKVWRPSQTDDGCGGWIPGEPFPPRTGPNFSDRFLGNDGKGNNWTEADHETWGLCTYVLDTIDTTEARPPFTDIFDGEACELFDIEIWDTEESPTRPGTPPTKRPIVSPPPPGGTPPGTTPFALCYEVNRMAFGERDVFGPDSDLLYTVEGGSAAGWARINWGADSDHVDFAGLIGLPVTGFWAVKYENNFVPGAGGAIANYAGLFDHKGNVRRSFRPRD